MYIYICIYIYTYIIGDAHIYIYIHDDPSQDTMRLKGLALWGFADLFGIYDYPKGLPVTKQMCARIAYFTRKTTYSNRKLPYRALINTPLLILIPF